MDKIKGMREYTPGNFYHGKQIITIGADPSQKHPDYKLQESDWDKVRDAMRGEHWIKLKREKYLPRPAGMSGIYEKAYDAYIERAHYPQICTYALSGALGIIVNKLPEFNVPSGLQYILEHATKDGLSLNQLFLNCIIEILQTGRCPILVDVVDSLHQFRFVQYTSESFINWKEEPAIDNNKLILGVLKEKAPSSNDIFSHDSVDVYRVLTVENGVYTARAFDESHHEISELSSIPTLFGKHIDEIPLFIAGSVSNSLVPQPIPLLAVAQCSIEIYRKEADLANSEFLSCNPTLCITGASNDDDLPNVVGSSVMMVLPDPQSRIFYTITDTAALQHVSSHISDLYEEAIRHGVAILDSRKGVEAAEALRIRQATQSASIYSMYLSVINAIKNGLQTMCKWAGYNPDDVYVDAPTSLSFGVPDSNVIRELAGNNVIPLTAIHKYLVSSGLLEQTVSYDDYMKQLIESKELFSMIGITPSNNGGNTNNVNGNRVNNADGQQDPGEED